MDIITLAVFVFVYFGMMLGSIPRLAMDRTGIAMLGAIAMIAAGRMDIEVAWKSVDVPTIALLLGLMVISAQFRLGGFYTYLTRRLAALPLSPDSLLALLMAASGVLSAVLTNDIVCLAMAPILVEGCARRRLNPLPFLLGLACSSNIGSAATLIGNPQNMLIGQTLRLSFGRYLLDAGIPSALGLSAAWWIIRTQFRGKWEKDIAAPAVAAPSFDMWQSGKGLLIITALVAAFLAAPWPREMLALLAAGMLLCSRKMASREILGLVDWQLLVLFVGLFVVNGAFRASGMLDSAASFLAAAGVPLESPAWLFGLSAILSNVVSNVPATMLLLPFSVHPMSGAVLALSSTLAGNLIVVGSIANIIVVDQAAKFGVRISWSEHARTGIPVTLATLAIAAAWLWMISALSGA